MYKDSRIDIDKGDWIPVLGSKQSKGVKLGKENLIRGGKGNRNNPIFTLFVDNLPADVSHRWVRNLFNKFGVVKNVFIPGKKSKVTGRLFGFVRYDCEVSAELAITKVNAIWIEDRKLFVKMATFDQNKENNNIMGRNTNKKEMGDKRKEVLMNQTVEVLTSENSNGFRTYAQAIKGFPGGKNEEKRMEEGNFEEDRKLILKPEGNGWLYWSVVAKLRLLISIDELKVQMAEMGIVNILVRAMGGRFVILTCNNKEEMGNLLIAKCLQRWFSEVKPWEDESTLRLSSFAVAKVLVATNVFDKIDEWINIEIEGKYYRVKVREEPCEQPFVTEKQIPIACLHVLQQQEREESRIGEENNELVVHVPNLDMRMDKFAKDAMDEVENIEVVAETQWDKADESPQLIELELDKAAEPPKQLVLAANSVSVYVEEEVQDSSISLVENTFPELDGSEHDHDNRDYDSIGDKGQDNTYERDKAIDLAADLDGHQNPVMEPTTLGSQNNLRASQLEGINLMVDLRPASIRRRIRSQIYDECMSSQESEFVESVQRQLDIESEFQLTIAVGNRLGVDFKESDALMMKEMIENETNRFAALQRSTATH
ncbi:hypothetical protein Vadar_014453 [Vaccinium darrowii]|uniref:Uncharacterized protein n=1 Tax=Vaccinium darrowii TaxID=229202 RepID=A0ACB7ZBR1_9ERIC|nr:hypothetical protein Vadar_014453 [Vaccinium darrowii]